MGMILYHSFLTGNIDRDMVSLAVDHDCVK